MRAPPPSGEFPASGPLTTRIWEQMSDDDPEATFDEEDVHGTDTIPAPPRFDE